ncbi:hypothetical protein QBC46DRAFT_53455 [Diplogelasinospora grovesii]|uniref:Uncharacterized protein n=1 Tax=Diplogelasinospora grovesii TaxID=303347 RepID=A0AAN6NCL7_9PEZI|nr:hypothetical protein QBC46DRAFT_53455 [Diplogelasinospora grovesii]
MHARRRDRTTEGASRDEKKPRDQGSAGAGLALPIANCTSPIVSNPQVPCLLANNSSRRYPLVSSTFVLAEWANSRVVGLISSHSHVQSSEFNSVTSSPFSALAARFSSPVSKWEKSFDRMPSYRYLGCELRNKGNKLTMETEWGQLTKAKSRRYGPRTDRVLYLEVLDYSPTTPQMWKVCLACFLCLSHPFIYMYLPNLPVIYTVVIGWLRVDIR